MQANVNLHILPMLKSTFSLDTAQFIFYSTLYKLQAKQRDFNPSLAEHDMSCLRKQCRFRSVGF